MKVHSTQIHNDIARAMPGHPPYLPRKLALHLPLVKNHLNGIFVDRTNPDTCWTEVPQIQT